MLYNNVHLTFARHTIFSAVRNKSQKNWILNDSLHFPHTFIPVLLLALPPTTIIPRKHDTYVHLVCYPLLQLFEHHLVHLRNLSFFTCGPDEWLTAVARSQRDCVFVVTKVRFMRSHIRSFARLRSQDVTCVRFHAPPQNSDWNLSTRR